nr:hypothetical protein [Pseudomonadota bacterium]
MDSLQAEKAEQLLALVKGGKTTYRNLLNLLFGDLYDPGIAPAGELFFLSASGSEDVSEADGVKGYVKSRSDRAMFLGKSLYDKPVLLMAVVAHEFMHIIQN